MNELSLFTGTGGGILGTRLLGWRAVGYVEWSKYCSRVLEQRIKDGILEDAPVYCGDVREFISHGFAESYQGVADGPSHRMDRFEAIGNGQVPAVAALAWNLLSR